MKPLDLILNAIPQSLRERIGWKLLRGASQDQLAFTDCFVLPYMDWANWLSGLDEAAWLLYAIARAHRPQVIVEIGSARGRSTSILSLACRQNGIGKVFAIDPNFPNDWSERGTSGDNYELLCRNIKRYGLHSWCEILREMSLDVAARWTKPIDLLFIDGDHSYEGVRSDYYAFKPFLTEDAIVAVHDSRWEHHTDSQFYTTQMGVPRFLAELQREVGACVTINTLQGLTLLAPNQTEFTFLPKKQHSVANA